MKTKITKTVFFALIFLTLNTNALTNFICTQDLNNNGVINFEEKKGCLQTQDNKFLCPLSTQLCTRNARNIYECPVAGNECMEVNNQKVCSPNKCIDQVANPPKSLIPPVTADENDGERDENGVCLTGNISVFSGRSTSCKNSGLTRDCCSSDGKVVLRDNGGNMITGAMLKTTVQQTFIAISAAYTKYMAKIAEAGTTIASASASAASAAAKEFITIDPNSVAVMLAIEIIQDFISCGQRDTNTVILRDSKYCHYLGEFCSEELADGICIVKSKQYCCFDSQLARIVQESAHEQIGGLSWGTAEFPQCGGMSADQFSKIDFNKLKLEKYSQEIAIQAKPMTIINTNAKDYTNHYFNQLPK
jgi:conjugal transfer mating pair stabilization protein TraN